MKKNLKKYSTLILIILMLSILILNIGKKSYALEDTYTREELEDIVVSTTLSYLYNKEYTEYDLGRLDEGPVGTILDSSFALDPTFAWADYTTTPETISRTNKNVSYCSSFLSLAYLNALKYENENYYKIGTSMYIGERYYFQGNTYYDSSSNIEYYKNATKYNGNSNFFLEAYASQLTKNYTTGETGCDGKYDLTTGTISGRPFYNNCSTNETPVAFYYEVNGGETTAEKENVVNELMRTLRKGDILSYRKQVTDKATGTVTRPAHVLMYVGDEIDKDTGVVHSTGYYMMYYEDGSLYTAGEDDFAVRYNDIEKYVDQIFETSETTTTTTKTANILVIRPINEYCNGTEDTCTAPIDENAKARNELSKLRIEQYSSENKTYIDNITTTNKTKKLNKTMSKYNSVNIGDTITYNLVLENMSNYEYCKSGPESAQKNKTSCNAAGYEWITGDSTQETYNNLRVTGQIPENTTFESSDITCKNNGTEKTCTSTCNFDGNELICEINKISPKDQIEINYTVKVTEDKNVTNEGMKITTTQNNELTMGEITTNVNPTINGINLDTMNNHILRINSAFINGKITYSSESTGEYKQNSSSIIQGTKLSALDFVKMIYYNELGIDLEYLTGDKVKEAIFNNLSTVKQIINTNTYTFNTTNFYTKKTSTEANMQTDYNNKRIHDMLVSGLYGGRKLHGNNSQDRVRYIRGGDLEFGDIILIYENNASSVSTYVYYGIQDGEPSLVGLFSDGLKMVTYPGNDENDFLIPTYIYDKDLFVVLRPTQVYGTTVELEYNGGNKIYDSFVAYNTYKKLPTPTKGDSIITFESNGGTDIAPEFVGNTFKGWSKAKTLYNAVTNTSSLSSTSAHKLYAKWNTEEITLPNPTKENYEFDGWYLDEKLETKAGDAGETYTPEGETTLYANWKSLNGPYNVEIKVENGTGSIIKEIEKNQNFETTISPNTGYEEYEISCTNDKEATIENNTIKIENVADEIICEVSYKPISYEIKYNANTGTGTMENSTHTYNVAKELTKNTYTKEGYTFEGWSKTPNGEVIYTDQKSITNLTTNNNEVINLYAVWTIKSYDVELKVINGTENSNENVEHGTDIEFDVLPNKGHSNPTLSCTNNQTGTIENNKVTVKNVTANTKCTVTYNANTYEIKYNANTGTGTMENSTHIYGISKELTKNTFTKEGYTFKGWSTEVNGTVMYIDQKSVINLTEKDNDVINLYAVWAIKTYSVEIRVLNGTENTTESVEHARDIELEVYPNIGYGNPSVSCTNNQTGTIENNVVTIKNVTATTKCTVTYNPNTYEVKYDANTGTGTMENTSHTYNESKNLSKNEFTKEGYLFIGWSTTKDGNATYKDEESIANLTSQDKEVVTLYAIWEKIEPNEFSVNINVENGKTDETSKIVKKNSSVTFTLTPNTGYETPSVTCTNSQIGTITNNILTIENVTANTTCDVTYKANTYEVKYNANGGIGTMENSSHTYGVSQELNKNTFTKTGYTFSGWSKTLNGEIEYIDEENVNYLTTKNNDIVNLYAVWKVENYTIKYNLNGGTVTNPESYNIETETFKLNNPVKEGYIFTGWTESNENVPEKEVTITKGTTGNKEYTANYEEAKYKVTYKADNGTITGITNEEVTYKNSPTGTTSTPNEGYEVLKWAVDKDVNLKGGTKVLKGDAITLDEIKKIEVTEDIVITIYHYKIKYTVTYESSENGSITGIKNEEVSHGNSPLGTKSEANKGYVLSHYIIDKDVTLTTGEVIKAGSPVTKENLSKIVVKENIKVTAIYEIATYKVTYKTDENGSITGIKEETKKYNESPTGTTVAPNKNYELLKWTADKEVTLKDNTKIAKGDVITEEEIKEIILESDITLTAHHVKTTFTVYYKNEVGTNITGILKEELKEGQSPKGTTVKTDNLNSNVIFKGNKDVTLKDGTIIKKGNVIKPEELSNIIVKEDLILTAYELKNSGANVIVPDTGSNKSLIIFVTGITLISLGGYEVYKRKNKLQ